MPSGKTHDSITFFLAVPAWLLVWRLTGSVSIATFSGMAFLFGGLMFGPDLDTKSVQYGRWGPFKFIWLPYKMFFRHRSFWTHGLIFGTLFRVVYFLGAFTLLSVGTVFVAAFITDGSTPKLIAFISKWGEIGKYIRNVFGIYFNYSVFGGLWLGAATHSLSDWAHSYIKTGKP